MKNVVAEKQVEDKVRIVATGCMGLCANEPTVEVIVPEMPTVIYGNVDVASAKAIVEEHIIGKKLLDKQILDRPSIDITK